MFFKGLSILQYKLLRYENTMKAMNNKLATFWYILHWMILNGCAKVANLAEHFQTRPSLLKRLGIPSLGVTLPRSWPDRPVRAVSPRESPASIHARAKFRQSTAAPFEAKLSEWLMVEWAQRESVSSWTSAAPSCSPGWSGRSWNKDSATSQARVADPPSIR